MVSAISATEVSAKSVYGTIKQDYSGVTKTEEATEGIAHEEKTTGSTNLGQLLSSRDGRQKLLVTLWVYVDYFAFAWLYVIVGPTLPDVRKLVGVDLQTASWIFSCFALGYVIGCPFHGFLYGKINNVPLMVVFAVIDGVLWIVTPWCTNFGLLLLLRAVGGIAWGGTDSACHSQLFAVWGSSAGPWAQFLYVVVGLGGMGSASALTPFLGPTVDSNTSSDSPFITLSSGHPEELTPMANASLEMDVASAIRRIQWPYTIAGLMSIFAVIPLCIYYFAGRCSTRTGIVATESSMSGPVETTRKDSSVSFGVVLLLLMVLNTVLTGMIDTYVAFFTTFAIQYLHWSNQDGAVAVAAYLMALAVGNITFALVTLFFGLKTKPLLIFALVGTVLSTAGLTVSSIFLFNEGVMVFNVLAGFMSASLWPAFFTYLEENVVSVAGKFGAILLGAGAFGMLINPLIIGYTMGSLSPTSFVYVVLIESVIVLSCFLCVFYLYRERPDKKTTLRG